MPQTTDSLYLDKLRFDPKLHGNFMSRLIKNTRLISLVIISLIIAGVATFANLPRELNPEIKIPIVNVITTLPGASPIDVERLVTKKLETEIADISTIDQLNSSSSDSVSVITVQFVSTQDPDEALVKVKEKVDLVTDLPEDASDPRTAKLDFNEQPVLIAALTGNINRLSLGTIAQDLADTLESNSAIRQVNIQGEPQEEILIDLRPETLVTYQVNSNDVTRALTSNNISLPAGPIQVGQLEYSLSLNNEFKSIDQIRALPVSTSQGDLPLGEIADVYYATKPSSSLVYARSSNSQRDPAIQLSILKSETATISQATDNAITILDEATQHNPNVGFITIINLASDVEESFNELSSNFRTTIILVFIVLFAFLGLRQASIASVSIPLTFLAAFTIMGIVGISINFLSLFSLLLALGLVVDDAIVIVQAAGSYGKKFTPTETGLLVFRDFVVPIWTTTLTTVWAFLPLLLATGIIGEFIKGIPIVVSATLLSSTTIAVLINIPLTTIFANLKIPNRVKITLISLAAIAIAALIVSQTSGSPISPLVLVAYVLLLFLTIKARNSLKTDLTKVTKRTVKNSRLAPLFSWAKNRDVISLGLLDFNKLTIRYRKLLKNIITSKKRRRLVYALSAGFVIISIIFATTGLLKNEFFPSVDSENLYVNIEAPAGLPLESTDKILVTVEDHLIDIPEIASIISTAGSSFDPQGSGGSGTNRGSIALTLTKEENRDRSSIDIATSIRQIVEPIQEARVTVVELSGGPPAGADFQINIKGPDLQELENISNQFMSLLSDTSGAINIDTSLKLSSGEIRVDLNQPALAARDLSAIQVASWLRTAVSGNQASQINLQDEEKDITIKLRDQNLSIDSLQNLSLPSQLGPYTLGEIAQLKLENSPVTIEREDQNRVVRVTAGTQGTSAQQILAQFETQASDLTLPPGYTWDVGGVNEENERSVQSIIQAMGISAILILITMVLQLESFRKAFLVMLVIPLAVAGVFFNFTIFGIPLSFPALIGVLALFGIVVNNSIMLVEKINQNLKFGFSNVDAVIDACASRIEPIFLTSLTTTAGLLPITLSNPLWRGLGGSIIAGLSVSGILILVLLPTLYIEIFDSKKSS